MPGHYGKSKTKGKTLTKKQKTLPSSLQKKIMASKKRIKGGSKEKMRKPGSKGAPTAKAFRDSAKTAKKK